MRKALPAARRVRKITGLRKIRHDEIGLLYERTHDPYVLLAHAVVERAVISHDGIGKDFDPAGAVSSQKEETSSHWALEVKNPVYTASKLKPKAFQ